MIADLFSTYLRIVVVVNVVALIIALPGVVLFRLFGPLPGRWVWRKDGYQPKHSASEREP